MAGLGSVIRCCDSWNCGLRATTSAYTRRQKVFGACAQEPPFLADARACIRNDGLMMVNCVSRSEAAYAGAVAALRVAFPTACHLPMLACCMRVGLTSPALIALH